MSRPPELPPDEKARPGELRRERLLLLVSTVMFTIIAAVLLVAWTTSTLR